MDDLGRSRRAFLATSAGAMAAVGLGSNMASATTESRRFQGYYVTNSAQLQSALSSALPGDSIVLENRTWTDLEIIIDESCSHGVSCSPITLRAETGGQVILSGQSRLAIGRDYWIGNYSGLCG